MWQANTVAMLCQVPRVLLSVLFLSTTMDAKDVLCVIVDFLIGKILAFLYLVLAL